MCVKLVKYPHHSVPASAGTNSWQYFSENSNFTLTMPWNYKRKTQSKYNLESLNKTKMLVESGNYSISSSAKAKGVPKKTLHRWFHKTPGKQGRGRKLVLTKEEEEFILIALEKCLALAWSMGLEEVTLVVKSYLDNLDRKEERIKNNLTSKDWLTCFKRWLRGCVRSRKSEVLTKVRAKCLNEETLTLFFNMYLNVLNENGFFHHDNSTQQIFNADETRCSTDPNKQFYSVQHVGKSYTLCLYVVLLLVNICHLLLCIRDNICMRHAVKMDQKMQGTVAHQVDGWVTQVTEID